MPSLKDREDAASICYRNLFKLEHALEGKEFLVIDIKYLKVSHTVSRSRLTGLGHLKAKPGPARLKYFSSFIHILSK